MKAAKAMAARRGGWTLADVLAELGLEPQFYDVGRARVDCPLCGYRDAMFYANDDGSFRAAYCVGCNLYGQTRRFVGRDASPEPSPTSVAIRAAVNDPKSRRGDIYDWDSPSLGYLQSRGISTRVARMLFAHDLKADSGVWMAVPMRSSTDPEPAFVDLHMTRLTQTNDGVWIRDRDAVEPYRRFRQGERVPGAVVTIGNNWDTAHRLFVAEGIENILSVIEKEVRKTGENPVNAYRRPWRGEPTVSFAATCGARELKDFRPPKNAKEIVLVMDEDKPGRDAVGAAKKRLTTDGLRVAILRPKGSAQDVNEELMETVAK